MPPQRRQVAAYGRPGLHPMRIARIDGFGCGFGDQGFQYVEGQFGPVQNLASQSVEVIDEIAGENRGQVKAYATVGVGTIYRAAQIAGERFELRGEGVGVSFDEKRYFGKIHAAALGKGLQGIENAPTVEACGKSLYSDASGRMYHSGFGGYGQAFGQRGDRRIADGQDVEVCGGQLARIGAPRGAVFEGECCTSFRVAGEDLEQCCSFRAAYRAGERFGQVAAAYEDDIFHLSECFDSGCGPEAGLRAAFTASSRSMSRSRSPAVRQAV